MTADLAFKTEMAKFSFAIRESRESFPPGEDVFHYTSADAFKEILSGGQIWLTNAAYLNDRNAGSGADSQRGLAIMGYGA